MDRPTIAFDIEVVAPDWEEIDEATRGYLLERARDDEERSAVPDRLALNLGLGRVVAIGMWNLDSSQGAVFIEGDGNDWQPWEGGPENAKLFAGSEREILSQFWATIARYGTLITFNGRSFDAPVLLVRSSILGVTPTRPLLPGRYDLDVHCDLMEVLTFHGAVRDRFRLEYWCRRFGLESPKSKLDGSQVGRYYREGRRVEIAEYCLQDTRATASLYQRVKPILIDPFANRYRPA
ncbi:MAG: ribonuclease H-like domain-containing protein [Planctomycetota bacterium]